MNACPRHELDWGAQPAPDPGAPSEQARRWRRPRRTASLLGLAGLAALFFAFSGHGAGVNNRGVQPPPTGLLVDGPAFAGHGELAFVSRGALFVLDGKTGRIKLVTPRGRDASEPAFSPNGRWLSYTLGSDTIGLAHADGSRPVTLRSPGSANVDARWLPDSRLVVGNRILAVSASGEPRFVAATPGGLTAWSPDGDRYAFVSRRVVYGPNGAYRGVEQLQAANSPNGPRTTWASNPISFTRNSGFNGDAINGVIVLPRRQGVLYWLDPFQSASLAADGMSLYLLRSPGARPLRLGVTVGNTVSAGPTGTIAIGAGANRYAWVSKGVETCSVSSGRCAPLRGPVKKLTLDPAWSPDGKTLVFVEAAAETQGDFSQSAVSHWYMTHDLWFLRAGSSKPLEIPGTNGATSPVWSANGQTLLYVSSNALWLLPRLDTKPVKIASPLFVPNAWPSYYGQVAWAGQFSWLSP